MKQRAYIALKATNLVLATAWSFALVFVLIRALPLHDYAIAVVVSAIGSYVMATDLGFSSVVYHRVRQAFFGGDARPARPLAVTSFGLYTAVAALATVVFATQIGRYGSPQLHAGFVLYFAGFVLALPWTIVRATAAATDHYLKYELAELARRVCALGLVLAMLFGLGFATYAALNLLAWAIAYAIVLPYVARALDIRSLSRQDWNVRAAVRENRAQMGAASVFSLMEFAIYNFPYLVLPLVFRRPLDVIPFDVFFKITRFGAQSYLVANEGLLPASTLAIHRGDRKTLVRVLGVALALSALPCIAGAVAITVFGDLVFALLLKDAALVPQSVRWGMAGVLLAMLFQAAAGILLLNTGKAAILARISVAMALSMVVLVGAGAALHIEFTTFMSAYVVVFSVGAVAYFAVLLRRVVMLDRAGGVW